MEPAPSPSEVQAVADEAELYLRSPLRIRTAGGGGDFSPRRIADVLGIELTGSDAGIRLGVDSEQGSNL